MGLGSSLDEIPLKAADALPLQDWQMRVDTAADVPGPPFGDEERKAEGFELIDDPDQAFRAAIGVKADDIGEGEGRLIDDVASYFSGSFAFSGEGIAQMDCPIIPRVGIRNGPSRIA